MNAQPKAVAQILTLAGFMRWAAGEPLRAKDFKGKEA